MSKTILILTANPTNTPQLDLTQEIKKVVGVYPCLYRIHVVIL